MAPVRVSIEDLPLLAPAGRGPIPGRYLLEGHAVGLGHLTMVLGKSHPGQGARRHRHDVEEVIIVHAGRGTYTVGDTAVEAGPGDVIIIPAGVPHQWVNHTAVSLYHTAVFPTGRFAMELIEDEGSD